MEAVKMQTKTREELKRELFEIVALAKSSSPISGAALASYISTEDKTYTDIEVRARIQDMRNNDDYFISANGRGYYLADSSEWLEYLRDQEEKLLIRLRRVRRLRNAYKRYNNEMK